MIGERESSWGDEISLEYGKRLQGYKDAKGRYRVFGANGPVGWTDKPLTEGPGVILGRKGVNRGVEFSKAPFFVIDTAYYVQPKSELDMRWLYYAIKHYKLGDINDGSPIQSTTRSAVYVKKMKGIKTRVKNLILGKRHSRRECLGPEALRASVPPHGAGYLKGLAKLTPG